MALIPQKLSTYPDRDNQEHVMEYLRNKTRIFALFAIAVSLGLGTWSYFSFGSGNQEEYSTLKMSKVWAEDIDSWVLEFLEENAGMSIHTNTLSAESSIDLFVAAEALSVIESLGDDFVIGECPASGTAVGPNHVYGNGGIYRNNYTKSGYTCYVDLYGNFLVFTTKEDSFSPFESKLLRSVLYTYITSSQVLTYTDTTTLMADSTVYDWRFPEAEQALIIKGSILMLLKSH